MNLTPDQLISFVSQFKGMLTSIMTQNAEILSILKKTVQDEELNKAVAMYDDLAKEFEDIFSGKKPLPPLNS